jgi:uncharacterized membrane protein
MTELTVGLWNVILESKGSLLRTVIYTIGHFIIAITCLMLIADVPLAIAATDAIVEPIANSVWYFVLDKWWASKVRKEEITV